jgi:hypothetical protein
MAALMIWGVGSKVFICGQDRTLIHCKMVILDTEACDCQLRLSFAEKKALTAKVAKNNREARKEGRSGAVIALRTLRSLCELCG